MAYDHQLAERVRAALGDRAQVTERRMFGGIAFMVGGNMAVGVNGDDLIVRVDPGEHEAALAEPGVRTFDMTGRPMAGWLLVGADTTASEEGLRSWVERGAAFASSLPSK
jgi:TfoX/Sxy family transcriptional regulator of competence genes